MVSREQCLWVEMSERLPPYRLSSPSGLAIIPKVDGSVVLGHAGVRDPQDFDAPLITEKVKMELLEEAFGLLPTVSNAKLSEHRGDFEGWSPPPKNLQPVLGRLPEWDNAYVACRLGTGGMMLSPGTGQVMADLIIAGGRIPDRVKTMMEVLSPARLEEKEQ